MRVNPLTVIDFYKTDHIRQYPANTTEIYSNFTARSAKKANVLEDFDNKTVFFGLQFYIKDFLINSWNENFFYKQKAEVISEYKRMLDCALGKDVAPTYHIEKLHDLGFLPIKIKALEEGTRVPIAVPFLTIVNTHPEFFWLTNFIETSLSVYLWKVITSATTSYEYRRLMNQYAELTGSDLEFVKFQVHDFSFRGMSSIEDAMISGSGHLTSFIGTDTIVAIDSLEQFYNAYAENELIGASVPATEHSVMCASTIEGEFEIYRKLLVELYPKGIFSAVSDTWNLWKVATEYIPRLKKEILSRDGKFVIRPDSGDPVKIICGDQNASGGSPENLGLLRIMWDIFGGEITHTGHKLLDKHIGIIYGDGVSIKIARDILFNMEKLGFSSGNIVFGVGSSTYQNVTRDSFSFAMKATSAVIDGKRISLFKDPVTDSGEKKSAKGLLKVVLLNGTLVLEDQQTKNQEDEGELKTIFKNGKILKEYSLNDIRNKLWK
jgi:nicotinamide phosphoribosyltransferase